MFPRLFNPSGIAFCPPVQSNKVAAGAESLQSIHTSEASRLPAAEIASIVRQVVTELQPRAVELPGLAEFLEQRVLPRVSSPANRAARRVAVARFRERVGVCGKCRLSWRKDSPTGSRCPRCDDDSITDAGIHLVDSLALRCLAESLIADGTSSATAKKHIAWIMTVLNEAAAMGLIPKVKAPRIANPETVIRVLSSSELQALYDACSEATWPQHPQFTAPKMWRAMLVCGVVYGMRIGELCALPWREAAGGKRIARGIHPDPECPHPQLRHLGLRSEFGWLVYLPAKQKDAKPLPLILPIPELIHRHLQPLVGDRHFVFDLYTRNKVTAAGNYRSVKISIYRQWDKLCAAAGIAADLRATPHDLRRTQETLYDDQFGKGTGAEVNGHASRSVSDSYYSQSGPRIHRAVLAFECPIVPHGKGTSDGTDAE